MEMVTSHYWLVRNGKPILFEASYYTYPIREGLQGFVKVPHSDCPCTCADRELYERRLAAFCPDPTL